MAKDIFGFEIYEAPSVPAYKAPDPMAGMMDLVRMKNQIDSMQQREVKSQTALANEEKQKLFDAQVVQRTNDWNTYQDQSIAAIEAKTGLKMDDETKTKYAQGLWDAHKKTLSSDKRFTPLRDAFVANTLKPEDYAELKKKQEHLAIKEQKAVQKGSGFIGGAGDIALSLGQSVVGLGELGGRLVGANDFAEGAKSVSEWLQSNKTDASQALRKKLQDAVTKAEKSGSTKEEIFAYLDMFKGQPLEMIAETIGPSLGIGAVARGAGKVALKVAGKDVAKEVAEAAAKKATIAAGAGTGAALGVAEVKGSQYETTYNEAKAKGFSDERAKAIAETASEYSIKNAGQQALGAGLGLIGAATGPLDRLIMGTAAHVGAKGVLKRTAAGVLIEGGTEALQEGQGQYAGNVAAIDQGVLDPSKRFQGVAGSAALGAAIGGAMGGSAGAIDTSGARQASQERALIQEQKAAIQAQMAERQAQARSGVPAYIGTLDPAMKAGMRIAVSKGGDVKMPNSPAFDAAWGIYAQTTGTDVNDVAAKAAFQNDVISEVASEPVAGQSMVAQFSNQLAAKARNVNSKLKNADIVATLDGLQIDSDNESGVDNANSYKSALDTLAMLTSKSFTAANMGAQEIQAQAESALNTLTRIEEAFKNGAITAKPIQASNQPLAQGGKPAGIVGGTSTGSINGGNDANAVGGSVPLGVGSVANTGTGGDGANLGQRQANQEVGPPDTTGMDELVGQVVDYKGQIGELTKQGDGYRVGATIIESGMSGRRPRQLGITALPKARQDAFRSGEAMNKATSAISSSVKLNQPSDLNSQAEALVAEIESLFGVDGANEIIDAALSRLRGGVNFAKQIQEIKAEYERILERETAPNVGAVNEQTREIGASQVTGTGKKNETTTVDSQASQEVTKSKVQNEKDQEAKTTEEVLSEGLVGTTEPADGELTSEDEIRLAELESDLDAIEVAERKLSDGKKLSLFTALRGRLTKSDRVDISPEFNFIALQAKGGRGASLADIVANGSVDEFLPFEMRHDSPSFDGQASEEYIKDNVRNGNYLPFSVTVELQQLQGSKSDIQTEIDAIKDFNDANEKLAELARERAIERSESSAIDAEGGAAIDSKVAAEEVTSPTRQDVIDQQGRKENEAATNEREQIRRESEAGAGQFTLTQEDGRVDDTGSLFSEKQPTQNPSNPASIRTAIEGIFSGMTGVWSRISKNTVVVGTVTELPSGLQQISESGQAFFNPKDGKIYLIADRIEAGTEAGVWLHEVFHKRGEELLGKEAFSKLGDTVSSWKNKPEGSVERQIYEAANTRAEGSGNYDAEFLAYAIEEAVNRGVTPNMATPATSAQGWLARVKAAFSSALNKLLGTAIKPSSIAFSARDLVSIAYGAAKLEYQFPDAKNMDGGNSKNNPFDGIEKARTPLGDKKTVTVNGKEYSVLNSDGKPIHPTVEGVRNFVRWFGDSKVTDNGKTMAHGGKPLVVYHGTKGDFSEFDPLKVGTASDQGWYGAGFYFTPDTGVASEVYANRLGGDISGANVIPAYLSIENPYDWRGENDRGLFQNSAGASLEKRLELESRGFDGVIVYDDYLQMEDGQKLSDEQWAMLPESTTSLLKREMVEESLSRKEWGYSIISRNYGKEFADSLPKARRVLLEIVAFKPTQIKSATGNTGAFNQTNADIRFSLANSVGNAIGSTSNAAKRVAATTLSMKSPEGRKLAAQTANGVLDRFRGFASKVVALRELANYYAKEFTSNGVNLLDVVTDLNTRKGGEAINNLGRLDREILKDYRLVDLKERELVGEAMSLATQSQFDPSSAKSPTTPEQKAAKDAYSKLTPIGKGIYRKVLNEHRSQWDRYTKEVIQNLRDSGADAQSIAKIQGDLDAAKMDVYFAQQRFGEYVVSATDPKQKELAFFRRYESRAEAMRDMAKVQKENPTWTVTQPTKYEQRAKPKFNADTESFMASLRKRMEAQGRPESDIDAVDSAIRQVMETRLVKKTEQMLSKRKGIAGADTDMLRASFAGMKAFEQLIAATKYNSPISKALGAVDNHIAKNSTNPDFDAFKAGQIAEAVKKSVYYKAEEGPGQTFVSYLNGFGFLSTMGYNVSSGLLNASSIPTLLMPQLLAKHGLKSIGAVTKAMKDISTNFTKDPSKLTGDVKTVIDYATEHGMLHYGEAKEILDVANGLGMGASRVVELGGRPMEWAEKFVNLTALLSSFRLNKAKGLSDAQALEEAKNDRYRSNFDNSSINKGALAKSPAGRVLMMLKGYGMAMTMTMMKDIKTILDKTQTKEERAYARKHILGMLGSHLILSGLTGMPFIALAPMYALAGLMADADDDRPYEEIIKDAVYQYLGKEGGNSMYYGLLGAGMASRVSMNDLIIKSRMEGADDKKAVEDYIKQILGPGIGNVIRFSEKSVDLYRELQTLPADVALKRFSQNMPIPSAANLSKGLGLFEDDGIKYGTDGRPLNDTPASNVEMLGQMLGFRPGTIAQAQNEKSAVQSVISKQDKRKKYLLQMHSVLGIEMLKGNVDPDVMDFFKEQVNEYNAKYPNDQIKDSALEKRAKKLEARFGDDAMSFIKDDDVDMVESGAPWVFAK